MKGGTTCHPNIAGGGPSILRHIVQAFTIRLTTCLPRKIQNLSRNATKVSAPMATSEASVITLIGALGLGCTGSVAFASAFLISSKALAAVEGSGCWMGWFSARH